jgi:hypothetical protein
MALGRIFVAPMPDHDFKQRTLDLWQPRSSRLLTKEDAREMADNVSAFFRLLTEWDQELSRQQEQPATDEQKTDA